MPIPRPFVCFYMLSDSHRCGNNKFAIALLLEYVMCASTVLFSLLSPLCSLRHRKGHGPLLSRLLIRRWKLNFVPLGNQSVSLAKGYVSRILQINKVAFDSVSLIRQCTFMRLVWHSTAAARRPTGPPQKDISAPRSWEGGWRRCAKPCGHKQLRVYPRGVTKRK